MKSDLDLLKESLLDLEWFQQNSKYIIENYEGQLIAIKEKSIIAFAPNMRVLMKKIKEKKINPEDILIEYVIPENFKIIL